MSCKKILFLCSEFPPQPGGIGNHAHYLALALQKEGKQVQVLTDTRSMEGKPEIEFDASLPFAVYRIQRNKVILVSYINRFLKAVNLVKNTDVVIASGKFSLWMVFFLQLFYKKKYIAVIHGSEVLLPQKLQRKFTNLCLTKFDNVIAVSNYTKSLVEDIAIKNISVIPNGFKISRENETNAIKKKPEKLHLITVGNVSQRKGQHNVIKALPLLLKKFPALQYHIVGIPTERKKIENLAKILKITKHIIFHGKVSEKKKISLLKGSSIFIMLSENTQQGDVEGFGIAILEANALGLPGIGSLDCGIEDAIHNEKSGVLVNAHAPKEVLDAVEKINVNYTSFSKNAVAWSKHFSWDKIIKKYIKVIEN